MHRITNKTKERAIEILVSSFRTNPGVLSTIKKSNKFDQRLYELCSYCINTALLKEGAYMTADQNGVALINHSTKKVALVSLLSAYFRLGTKCIGWDRAIPILWKERIIKSKRPKTEYLYFWMLAVEDKSFGLRTIIEIRDFTYAMSATLDLPIVAETRLEKNRKIYERYGFKCYDAWKPKTEENEVWFLIRNPLIT